MIGFIPPTRSITKVCTEVCPHLFKWVTAIYVLLGVTSVCSLFCNKSGGLNESLRIPVFALSPLNSIVGQSDKVPGGIRIGGTLLSSSCWNLICREGTYFCPVTNINGSHCHIIGAPCIV